MPEFYWCQQCECKFLAESTHREFKQAICKQCSATCSDFEFEIEEAERIQEAEENGDVALGALLTALFGLFGFVANPKLETVEPPIIFEHRDDSKERPSVFIAANHDDAKRVVRQLGNNGVIAQAKEITDKFGTRILVLVDRRDRNRARKFLSRD